MSAVTEKYRLAAIIAQNALKFVLTDIHTGIGEKSIGEICRNGDAFITDQINKCFKTVEEKGIAQPVEICKNEFITGVSPEEPDVYQGGVINEGDVVKVSLGAQIDGYTVLAGHTVIVNEQKVESPYEGPYADACIGAYMATEAVIGLLTGSLSENHSLYQKEPTGGMIRSVVDNIAQSYGLTVVPGSRIRRIKRFVCGQSTVRDTLPTVEWRPKSEDDESDLIAELDAEFVATPGHTYLIDIQMAHTDFNTGYIKLSELQTVGSHVISPSIYTRDHTVNYSLRTNAARQLLGSVDNKLGVYPFKLNYLGEAINKFKLGLNECIQKHLIVGEPIYKAVFVKNDQPKNPVTVPVAREVATVKLIPAPDSTSGYPELLRLSGGKVFPPSWTHSKYSMTPGIETAAIESRINGDPSVKYIEVKPNYKSSGANGTNDMDVEL